MYGRTAEGGVVLQLCSSDGGAVVGNEDQLGLSSSHRLDGVSVSWFYAK